MVLVSTSTGTCVASVEAGASEQRSQGQTACHLPSIAVTAHADSSSIGSHNHRKEACREHSGMEYPRICSISTLSMVGRRGSAGSAAAPERLQRQRAGVGEPPVLQRDRHDLPLQDLPRRHARHVLLRPGPGSHKYQSAWAKSGPPMHWRPRQILHVQGFPHQHARHVLARAACTRMCFTHDMITCKQRTFPFSKNKIFIAGIPRTRPRTSYLLFGSCLGIYSAIHKSDHDTAAACCACSAQLRYAGYRSAGTSSARACPPVAEGGLCTACCQRTGHRRCRLHHARCARA